MNSSRRDSSGNEIGPKRVYLLNEPVPGLAMSRSLGDSVAHSVGVSTHPEIFDYMIAVDDIALVIASDGVWEVLRNEDVARIVKTHHQTMQAELCANLIIQSAADLWISTSLLLMILLYWFCFLTKI